MKLRTILLAEQLLGIIPQTEINDLIKLLQYYNQFAEKQRVLGMKSGSQNPTDLTLESEVKKELSTITKSTRNQAVYVTTNQQVCSCCGK